VAAAYNLRDEDYVGVVDVQFSPITTPMIAWYAGTSEDGSREWIEQRPVIGAIVRHEVNAEGEVVGSSVKMAVPFDETDELLVANDPLLLGWNEDFVGVYPAGVDAPSDAVSATRNHIRERLAQKKPD
jgi:hypothetical protein